MTDWLLWEDDRHVLAAGQRPHGAHAVLRLSTTGTAERISPFRGFYFRIEPSRKPDVRRQAKA